ARAPQSCPYLVRNQQRRVLGSHTPEQLSRLGRHRDHAATPKHRLEQDGSETLRSQKLRKFRLQPAELVVLARVGQPMNVIPELAGERDAIALPQATRG